MNETENEWVRRAFWEIDVENSINVLKVIYEKKWKFWLKLQIFFSSILEVMEFFGCEISKKKEMPATTNEKKNETSSRNRKLSTRIIYSPSWVWEKRKKKYLKSSKCEKWIINNSNVATPTSTTIIFSRVHMMMVSAIQHELQLAMRKLHPIVHTLEDEIKTFKTTDVGCLNY